MPDSKPHTKFGKRHILVFWLFTGLCNLQILRTFPNIAIVSMVNNTMPQSGSTELNGTCPVPESSLNESETRKEGEFNWDYETQGLILSSYYYGYASTQIIAGYVVRKTGARLLIGVGVGAAALLTIINPFAARVSPDLLIVVRVIQGLLQGTTVPSIYHLLGFWAPKSERTSMFMIPITGTLFGTIISSPLTGWLCDYGFAGGWPSTFYVFGGVAILWSVGWFLSVHDSPSEHPSISEKERIFIEQECPNASRHSNESFWELPWKSILTSIPVWALLIAQFCENWGYYTLLTESATYLSDVLHMGTFEVGLLFSIPYACYLICQVSSAILADVIRANGVRTPIVRKTAYTIGAIISSTFLIVISYVGCDVVTVIAILSLCISMKGVARTGIAPCHADLAPQYAGILMGITNTAGTIPGIVSPIITGAIIGNGSTIDRWRTVFIISSVITLFGAIIFDTFGQAEVQPWALKSDKDPIHSDSEAVLAKTIAEHIEKTKTIEIIEITKF